LGYLVGMSRGMVRAALRLLTLGCIVGHSTSAHAENGLESLIALILLEPLVPDLRLEFDDKKYAVLSWPVHVDLTRIYANSKRVRLRDPVLRRYLSTAFIEPQWRPADGSGRFVAGTRQGFSIHGFGILTDIAGVVGGGGAGVVVGAGPAFVVPTQMTLFGLIYRQTMTTEGPRSDISLDLGAFFL
jgi:hypothetical protein